MALQAIIFDFDGTISPTNQRQYKWFQFWAKENERELDYEAGDKKLVLDSLDKFMDFYNFHCNSGGVQKVYYALKLPCDMNDKKHPVWIAYEKFKAEHPAGLCDGMKETLDALRKTSRADGFPLKLAVNTNNKLKSVEAELRAGGVLDYFQCFVTEEVLAAYHGAGNPDAIKKPSRIPMALSLNLLGVEGNAALHVGDTIHDLLCCQKVMRRHPACTETLKTAGAAWGYEGRARLEQGAETADGKLHFDYIIDKPGELVEIVRKLIY